MQRLLRDKSLSNRCETICKKLNKANSTKTKLTQQLYSFQKSRYVIVWQSRNQKHTE